MAGGVGHSGGLSLVSCALPRVLSMQMPQRRASLMT